MADGQISVDTQLMNSASKTFSCALGILALILLGGCAASPPAQTSATEKTEPQAVAARDLVKDRGETVIAQENKDDLICRTVKPTGSRFGQKTCLTKEEWQSISDGGRRAADKLLRGGMQGQPTGAEGG